MSGYVPYSQQLKDPRWQRRRLEILQRSDFRCECCDASDKTLHVHHKRYYKGRMAWEYADHELAALCADCHETEHMLRELLTAAIAELPIGDLEYLLGFAEGMVASNEVSESEDGDVRRTWPLRSYEHAWGFLARLRGIPSREVESCIDAQPLSAQAIWSLSRGGKPS